MVRNLFVGVFSTFRRVFETVRFSLVKIVRNVFVRTVRIAFDDFVRIIFPRKLFPALDAVIRFDGVDLFLRNFSNKVVELNDFRTNGARISVKFFGVILQVEEKGFVWAELALLERELRLVELSVVTIQVNLEIVQ
jgi:hypothetical protein